MKKLLISLGVVAMMFFAQAADVNAKTCDQKAEAECETDRIDGYPQNCCMYITCNNTSNEDRAIMCNKHCTRSGENAVAGEDCY